MAVKVREWVADRTGLNGGSEAGGARPLPRGMGWMNALGPALIALLIFEAITGIFLAMFYSPHPDAAYESMRYVHHLPMGKLVHGLHRYGETAIIIVLGLHLVRTYLRAAYKPPRELVWITGVLLLILMLGFGFTGSLLPWDQNAYWATKVRTSYAAGVPLIGELSGLLLRGGQEVGAMTLTRFYAIHNLLLPALLVPLIVAHVKLSWLKGPAPNGEVTGESARATGYYRQAFRIVVASFALITAVYVAAAFWPAELEFKANPADGTYNPRAEWYFMFLLQIVKDWGTLPGLGKLSWVPVVVLPGIVMTFLLLAPWIDRGAERKIAKRPLMLAALGVGALVILGFTARGYAALHPSATPEDSLYGHFTSRGTMPLNVQHVMDGEKAFAGCGGCHKAYGDFQGRLGPDLTGYGLKTFLASVDGHPEAAHMSYYERYKAYLRGDLRPANSKMPKYTPEMLPDAALDATAVYISQDPVAVARAAAAQKAAAEKKAAAGG